MDSRLDYEPIRTPWWSGSSGRRFWRRLIVAALGVLGLVGLFVIVTLVKQSRSRAYFNAAANMRELNGYAQDMIVEEVPGTALAGRERFVTSFDAFYDYVARRRPELVSRRDAPNPFPGLLTGRRYARPSGPLSGPDDLLIWDEEVHHRTIGDAQFRNTAGGRSYDLLKSGPPVPTRAPPASR
jgi:hypothetical protein